MLVVIATSTIVIAIVIDSVLMFYRTNTTTFEQAVQVDNARRGNEYLVRDVREAAYADDGSFPLVQMGTSSLTFYSDTDRDSSAEKIRYFLQGTSLMKGVVNATGSPPSYGGIETTSSIAEYIRNNEQGIPVFRYYTTDATEVAAGEATTSISFVTVDLVVNVDVNRLPGQFTLHSSATLRNLK